MRGLRRSQLSFGVVPPAASFGFARSTNSDEQAAESVISKRNGEIIRAKATCLTHTIIMSNYIRPVFTTGFIRGLKTLHEKTET